VVSLAALFLVVNQHGCLSVLKIKFVSPLNLTVIDFYQRDNDLEVCVPCHHENLLIVISELQADDFPLEVTDKLPHNI
jgi:hypothetical protein